MPLLLRGRIGEDPGNEIDFLVEGVIFFSNLRCRNVILAREHPGGKCLDKIDGHAPHKIGFKPLNETIVGVETAKSVKSLGLKDNTTNQIRMKIYSVHIQTAWVETKTVKK